MDPEFPIDLNDVGSPLTCKWIQRKIPYYDINVDLKLLQVQLPYPRTTYWISFGGRAPQQVKMPRSRMFDQMLEFPGDNTIEYDLTTRKRFLRAIDNQYDKYILNYLDIYPTYWVYKFEDYTVYFTTIGSIFHGDFRVEKREHLIVSTTCDFDTIKPFHIKIVRDPIFCYNFSMEYYQPRQLPQVSRHPHRHRRPKMK